MSKHLNTVCKAVSFITSSEYCWLASLVHLHLRCTCYSLISTYLILKSEDTPVLLLDCGLVTVTLTAPYKSTYLIFYHGVKQTVMKTK